MRKLIDRAGKTTLALTAVAAVAFGAISLYGVTANSHGAAPEEAKAGAAKTYTVKAGLADFSPLIVNVQPGDKVAFTKMSGHNVETLKGLVPEGQEYIITDMGKNATLTFEKEGIVVYKCTPHWGALMGGFIIVGEPKDPQAIIEKYREVAKANDDGPALEMLDILEEELATS